jgi:hypothetical protein
MLLFAEPRPPHRPQRRPARLPARDSRPHHRYDFSTQERLGQAIEDAEPSGLADGGNLIPRQLRVRFLRPSPPFG